MKILIDTNVILDYLLCREPYQEDAKMIINACKEKKVIGCIAAHTVSNIFFILRKVYSVKERRDILNSICQLFEVESINKEKIIRGLNNDKFSDFEDCLQMECAISFQAEYIVTRNIDDFKGSSIACILPSDLLDKFGDI